MDLRRLECFVAVAEELHFGRAALRLYLGQPTVSEAVRRLETDLGGDLFDRSSRRVRLTPLGERFLPEARSALLQVQRAYEVGRAFAQRRDEPLTIGYAEDIGQELLLRCLPELRAQFPSAALMPRRLDTRAQLDGLERGSLDVGIGWGPVTSHAVAVMRLSRERFVALVPEGHPLAEHSRLRAEQLSGLGVLTWPHQANSGLCDRLIAAFEQAGASLRIVRTADGIAAIGTHVAAGGGIGLAVTSAVPGDSLPGIRAVPLAGPSTTADRVLLVPKKPLHPAQERLVELLLAAGSAAAEKPVPAVTAAVLGTEEVLTG